MRGDCRLDMLGGKPSFAPRRIKGIVKIGERFAHFDLAQQGGGQTKVRLIHAADFFRKFRAQLFCAFGFR